MTTTPILTLPNMNDTFTMETDASYVGIGVFLMQRGHPVVFISKALSKRQQVLSVNKKELLVVLLAIKKWQFYLID